MQLQRQYVDQTEYPFRLQSVVDFAAKGAFTDLPSSLLTFQLTFRIKSEFIPTEWLKVRFPISLVAFANGDSSFGSESD